MERVRVGLIGLGEVAQVVHLPILRALGERYEVRAACDVSRQLLDVVGAQYSIPALYTEYEELCADPDLDAVFVLNSDEYHADCVIAAAAHGKHVLVEKPMCLASSEAEAIIRARDEAGVQVMVAYMRRFAPAFVRAVEEVRALEKINYARIHAIIGPNRYFIDQSSNVLRPDDVPEAAMNDRAARARRLVQEAIGDVPPVLARVYRLMCGLSSHDLSAMREIIGAPNQVRSAHQWNNGRFIAATFEYDDYYAVFETGVDDQGRFDCYIEVLGQRRTVKVVYDTPYIRHLPPTLQLSETVGDAYIESIHRPTYKDPYTHELEYFHDVVARGTAPKTTPEDFQQDLKLFKQIVEAIQRE